MRPLLAMLIATNLAVSCTTTSPPTPPKPAPAVDAGACGTAPTCVDVCCRGKAMGCAWAKPTPNGSSCVDVCNTYQAVPPPLKWNLEKCISASTCGECGP